MSATHPSISVIMPTYNQATFIKRAIASLRAQTWQHWELIIINDGATDYTEEILEDCLTDQRIRYYKNETNKGLGHSLNQGLDLAKHEYICYLPSDDIYYADHIASLYAALSTKPDAILCYSGLQYAYTDTSSGSFRMAASGKIPGNTLQLVQVMHRRTQCRWVEREELVTDDLDLLFWNRLSQTGAFINHPAVTCEWVDHPHQHHKIIQESHMGGINLYKRYYQVTHPLKFQSTVGNYIDEWKIRNQFPALSPKQDGLKILIVGELAYNAERIYALEEAGHQLYGLWIDNPHAYNAVGPFPFGNITDLSLDNWQEEIQRVQPDIIYALLNYQAVPLANYVLRANTGIPFVWHFKEGPFFCRSYGIWKELIELYYNADGRIFINPEMEQWFAPFLPPGNGLHHILDGDLPSGKWFSNSKSSLLSDADGPIHTVVSGRPYGLTPGDVGALASQNIHLHLYGDHTHSAWAGWIAEASALAGQYLHLHPHCEPEHWVKEFSQYDAGWLHVFTSNNNRELMRCTWDDLNYPARMATLAAAGLPMLQKNNSAHLVASESLVRKLNTGLFFDSIDELATLFNNRQHIQTIRKNVWENRKHFSFDHHAPALIDFFRKVIDTKRSVSLKKTVYAAEGI